MSSWARSVSTTFRNMRLALLAAGLLATVVGRGDLGQGILLFSLAATLDFALLAGLLEWRRTARARRLGVGVLHALFPTPLRRAVLHEIRVLKAFYRALTFRPLPEGPTVRAYSYRKDPQPMQMAVALCVLSVFELPLVHVFLNAIGSPLWVHGLAAYLSVYGLVFILADLRLLRESAGHWLSDTTLEIRFGARFAASVPRALVRSVTRTNEVVRSPTTLRVTAGAAPNVTVRLATPICAQVLFVEKRIDRIDLYVDQPDALIRALVDPV